MSTYFRLELIEPSAREVFIFWTLVEREKREASEEGGEQNKPNEIRNSVTAQKKTVDPQHLLQTTL